MVKSLKYVEEMASKISNIVKNITIIMFKKECGDKIVMNKKKMLISFWMYIVCKFNDFLRFKWSHQYILCKFNDFLHFKRSHHPSS